MFCAMFCAFFTVPQSGMIAGIARARLAIRVCGRLLFINSLFPVVVHPSPNLAACLCLAYHGRRI